MIFNPNLQKKKIVSIQAPYSMDTVWNSIRFCIFYYIHYIWLCLMQLFIYCFSQIFQDWQKWEGFINSSFYILFLVGIFFGNSKIRRIFQQHFMLLLIVWLKPISKSKQNKILLYSAQCNKLYLAKYADKLPHLGGHLYTFSF